MIATFLHSGDLSLWELLTGVFVMLAGLALFATAVLWLISPEMFSKLFSKLTKPQTATPHTEETADE